MTDLPDDSLDCVLKGHQWVVFGPDWDRHPSASQHLFRQFLGSSRVIWVETVGLRSPSWSRRDLFRSCQKLFDFITRRRTKVATVQGLTIVCPLTLPFTRWAIVRRLNLWQVRRRVTAEIRRLGFDKPKLVVTVPSQCDYVGVLGEILSIYYCLDDYALWRGMQPDHVRRMEAKLVNRVDAFVVASESLMQQVSGHGKPVLLLTHGVDLEHFQPCQVTSSSAPFEMVYFGMVDDRVDQDLLVHLANAQPDGVVRLIGPVTVSTKRLQSCPNIRIEGRVTYEKLPNAIASAGVFLLPFHLNELSFSCSPIKIKEYLACGKPIVAMAIPEAAQHQSMVLLAADQKDFLSAVQSVRNGSHLDSTARVPEYLACETWRAKTAILAAAAHRWVADKAARSREDSPSTQRMEME